MSNWKWTGNNYVEWKEEEHPRNDEGEFAKKEMSPNDKIESVHIERNKDNILPELNEDTLQTIGLTKNKPVLVKASVIERNISKHFDIDIEETNKILGNALYSPSDVFLANEEKPYYCFVKPMRISKKNGEEEYGTVILDVDEFKENFEVVHWHYVKLKGLKKIKKPVGGL